MTNAVAIPANSPVLVLGVNGQDGSYLAECLMARGYRVTGCGRQPRSRYVSGEGWQYRQLDITNLDALATLLLEIRPAAVFHFAAVHGAAGFNYEAAWQDVQTVNTGAVQAILEYARRNDPDCRLVYASSSKVFGEAMPARIDENTPKHSTCLYSISKNASQSLIDYYRRHHGAKASIVYLFNHESPRRPPEYFVPKLVSVLASAMNGDARMTQVNTFGFHCNWGDAQEYMGLCVDVMERAIGADYVLAHDVTWFGRDMAVNFFARYGMDVFQFVEERFAAPPVPSSPFNPSNTALERAVGRKPHRGILDVCDDILRLNHPEAWSKVRAS